MSEGDSVEHRGRVVVVTGAASGIGLAAARLAAQRGQAVALLDRDAESVATHAAALREQGVQAVGLGCDVREEQQVDQAFSKIAAELGVATGVVASAGIDRSALLHELDATAWDEVLDINLRGMFLTCRAALRHMMQGSGGSIVCVASPFGLVAAPGGISAYAASKGGILALVRSLSVDYGQHGIRVNAVLPGPTETPLMWANVADDQVRTVRATVATEVPLGRLADPNEPARTALWLLSDDASYVTGAQLACDGGILAKAAVSV